MFYHLKEKGEIEKKIEEEEECISGFHISVFL